MSLKFKRTVEDFVCEHCGNEVKGTGFTNHCPKCLWSKHVDIFPGDRLEVCGGMMEPIGVERKGDTYILIQRCVTCGSEFRIKVSQKDDFDEVVKIAKKSVDRILNKKE
ncbi:MAG: RNHCP domain-containing protein [Candidatus Paceibacterota bacterium]